MAEASGPLQEVAAAAPADDGAPISLRVKVAALVGTLVLLTAGIVIGGAYLHARRLILNGVWNELTVLSEDRAAIVREFIRRQVAEASEIAGRPRLRYLLREHMQRHIAEGEFVREVQTSLREAERETPDVIDLKIAGPDGRIVCATLEGEIGKSVAGSSLYRAGVERGTIGEFHDEEGRRVATVAVPIRWSNPDQLLGVMLVRSDVTGLRAAVLNLRGLRRSGNVLLGENEAGVVRYLLPDRGGRELASRPALPSLAIVQAINGEAGIALSRGERGQPILAARQPIQTAPWGLVVEMDVSEAQAPLREFSRFLLLLGIPLLAFGTAASYLLARRLTRPLRELTRSARRVSAGELDTRVAIDTRDEIGVLARTFNRMTSDLAASYAHLEERVRQRTEELARSECGARSQRMLLQSMLDYLADGVVATGPGGEFLIYNPAAVRMVGAGPTEKPPEEWTAYYGLYHVEDGRLFEVEELPLVRAMKGESVDDLEVLVKNPAHPEGVIISINARPLLGDEGQPQGGIVVFRDVTAQKATEEAIRQSAHELARSNEQLQRFAQDLVKLAASERRSRIDLETAQDELKRIERQLMQAEKMSSLGMMVAGVAHEINNPLAYVSSNMAVLQRDLGYLNLWITSFREAEPVLREHDPALLERLEQQAAEFDLDYTQESLDGLIARSREGLRRIEQIVRDLRDFARVDAGDYETVDLNHGIQSTVNIVKGRAKAQDVELVVDLQPLPLVTCQAGKVHQVVLNLLINALDACAMGGHVTLRTRPMPEKQAVRIEVQDDGTGMPEEILPRIFDPFFTTKPLGKGTGLGLSISYGIVQTHGGVLDVESTLGVGTCFTVTLPVQPPGMAKEGAPGGVKSS